MIQAELQNCEQMKKSIDKIIGNVLCPGIFSLFWIFCCLFPVLACSQLFIDDHAFFIENAIVISQNHSELQTLDSSEICIVEGTKVTVLQPGEDVQVAHITNTESPKIQLVSASSELVFTEEQECTNVQVVQIRNYETQFKEENTNHQFSLLLFGKTSAAVSATKESNKLLPVLQILLKNIPSQYITEHTDIYGDQYQFFGFLETSIIRPPPFHS